MAGMYLEDFVLRIVFFHYSNKNDNIKLAVRTVIKSEKCCGNKSCSVSGGGLHSA